MGTVMNGNKWSGACVGGNVVSGLAKNGVVFYNKKAQGYFIVEYTDTNNASYTDQYNNADDLLNFTEDNTTIKICKITTIGQPEITNTSHMFDNCSNLINLDLSNFNTDSVKSTMWMFSNCSNLTNLDLSNFNTSSVTSMRNMFSGCSSLTSLDLSSFDTSNVFIMAFMFSGCSSLTSLDLSSFDFSIVSGVGGMFSNVQSDCLIKVKDQTAKDFVLGVRSDLTNVVIV